MVIRAHRPASKAAIQPTAVVVELSAVIVAVIDDEPKVLVVRSVEGACDALPSGPLEPRHRTLEVGLRTWIAEHTRQAVGYVEQLYTFGDSNRQRTGLPARVLSIGYLALVPAAQSAGLRSAHWRDWYQYFPWEDWRSGEPAALAPIRTQLRRWTSVASSQNERRVREERVYAAFGSRAADWNDERVLERYELLYQAGVVPEAHRDRGIGRASRVAAADPYSMASDHRRILATAIARLRGKIKYRPVVFELIAADFTLSKLQRIVEGLAGVRLHAPNFRRVVANQRLVEDTGEVTAGTGGRPARLVRFRREVLLERPGQPVKLPIAKNRAQ
jgi:hypothetical protein